MTPGDARTFLDYVRGDRLEALYVLALAVGMRQGELLAARWHDIDWDGGTLTIRRSLQRVDGKLTDVELKTPRSNRTVSLPHACVIALREHRTRQLRERLVAAERWQDNGDRST